MTGERRNLTNKAAYEAVGTAGEIVGPIGPRDWNHFRQTLRFIPKNTGSLLDVGCDRGYWLGFVTRYRPISKSLGVDISEARISEAQRNYPHLRFKAAYLEKLEVEPASYDVVTGLEVLEHIPEWLGVLDGLLRIARKPVVITVPYREERLETVCIHCGKATPVYGRLRSYDESTFPERQGWKLSFGYIRDWGIGRSLARRIYRSLFPSRKWLVACYDTASGSGAAA